MSSTQMITFQKAENTCVHSTYQLYSFIAGWTGMSFKFHCPSPHSTLPWAVSSLWAVCRVEHRKTSLVSFHWRRRMESFLSHLSHLVVIWSAGYLFLISDSQSGLFRWSHMPRSLAEADHGKALDVYSQCPVGWCWPAAFSFFWWLAASSDLLLTWRDQHIRRNFLHDVTDFGNGKLYSFALFQ